MTQKYFLKFTFEKNFWKNFPVRINHCIYFIRDKRYLPLDSSLNLNYVKFHLDYYIDILSCHKTVFSLLQLDFLTVHFLERVEFLSFEVVRLLILDFELEKFFDLFD